MAEKDFIVEKQRIITAIEEIDRKLAEIKDDDTEGPLADEEFIEKASYFIMVSKLLEDRSQHPPFLCQECDRIHLRYRGTGHGDHIQKWDDAHIHLQGIKKAQGHARLWAFIRRYTVESAYRFCVISYTSVNECKQDPLILASSVLDKECREGQKCLIFKAFFASPYILGIL